MSVDVAAMVSDNLDLWTSATERKSGAGRGGKKANLYGIERLRALILDLAVRGKLVPQDLNDESASTLLGKLAAEMGKASQGRKVRQPLEKRTSNEEYPFSLPEGWIWTDLGNLAETITSGSRDWSKYLSNDGAKFVTMGNLSRGSYELRLDKLHYVQIGDDREGTRTSLRPGDLVVSITGDVGNMALIPEGFGEAYINQHTAMIRLLPAIRGRFIPEVLRSPMAQKQFNEPQRGVKNSFRLSDVQNIQVPLPPLAEQQRIVAKVDELMALCDALEAQSASALEAHQILVETLLATLVNAADPTDLARQWARLETHFDILFTTDASIEALQRATVHLAVLGKLVRRNPDDEPAKEALRKASKAKEVLFQQEGLRARSASLTGTLDCPEGTLPDHWVITNFDTVFVILSGVTKGQRIAAVEAIEAPYLRVANVQRGYLDLDEVKSIIVRRTDFERYRLRQGDVLMTEGGDWDKLGRAAIWNDEIAECIHQNHVFRVRSASHSILPKWVAMFVNSPLGREYFGRAAKQTTNLASINLTQLRACPLPIPPLAEQRRIVARVDELMALCEGLRARLADAARTQRHLADAIVEQAVV